MSAIILLYANDPEMIEVLQDEEGNHVFDSVDEADMWLQRNAKIGWCTRIIDTDD